MRARLALAVLLSAVALAACGPVTGPSVRFEASGAPLTSAGAEKLAASTDIGALSRVTTAEAPSLRDEMLAQLRAEGAAGVRAAELLTAGFPERTASVPVLVRDCSVDGIAAVVVVEAYGDTGKTLTHRRLWVFDRATGAILRAASFF